MARSVGSRFRHGSGMRRMACLSVGVKDVDFDGHAISVREGKGGKDRVVMLPRTRVGPLQTQLNPNFPLACSSRVMGGEFDRQIELRGLIPKSLHPLPVLHGHCQVQDRLSAFCGGVGRLGK